MRKTYMYLLLALLLSGAALGLGLHFWGGETEAPPSREDYYRQLREGFAAHNAEQSLSALAALAAQRPQSGKDALNLCLGREYFQPESPQQACYAEAAQLYGPPPHDPLTALDYAVMLRLADAPGSADAAQAYIDSVPLPDGEYFQELIHYERSRLVRTLLRPLGLLP